ncbi:MAG: rod shape-determining protein RodA [Candidatus Stahlbacteria bacterium]|nr:rod shape-determining protein RodA [Candidatus Stahlbacteria bacterium]
MILNRNVFRDFDFVLLGLTLFLVFVGLISVYSTTYGESSSIFLRQLLWVFIGLIVGIIFYLVPLRAWDAFSWVFYLASLVGVILVFVIGTGSHGAKRWIDIGGIRLQPSEIAKLGTLLFLTSFLCNKKFRITELRHLILPVLIVVVPFFLVLVEPDLGTSLIFLFFGLSLLFYKGTPLVYLFVIISPVLALICGVHWISLIGFLILAILIFYFNRLPLNEFILIFAINLAVGLSHSILWGHLKPYQQARITNFLVPSRDLQGSGWQILQSKIAIGSGSFLGKGILKGTQKGFDFLPEVHTDFIFSAIGEEFGFLGCCVVLICFFLALWRGFKMARAARSEFNSFLAIGIVSILGIQILINVGMTTGLVPTVGVPLSFISYGGSSMIVSSAMMGLLLNVAKHRYEY